MYHDRKAINLAAVIVLGCIATVANAQSNTPSMTTKAAEALLIDDVSGTVLLNKQGNVPIPPASLVKLMTAEIVFEALEKGEISLETPYVVSENAWRTGGAPSRTSTMFARLKSSPTVSDLLQGLIVQGANDGAIILAEGMAGNEQAFAQRMNQRAKEIGLTDSVFVNATGLPASGQQATLEDLIVLARHIRTQHPDFYKFYGQEAFSWNNIFQRNRNPLLKLEIGADGLATGYTEGSGYALIGSAEQNGRRLFLGLSGLSSIKDREEEAKKLIQWGMTGFDQVRIYAQNDEVGHAQVFGGETNNVPLKVMQDIELLLPKDSRQKMVAKITYDGPLHAPVNNDVQIGVMAFELNGNTVRQVPVYTAKAVPSGSLSQRALDSVMELTTGWLRKYL